MANMMSNNSCKQLLYAMCAAAMLLPSMTAMALELRPMPSPASGHSAQPHLSVSTDGTLVLSWLEQHESEAVLRYSVLSESVWQPARTVVSGSDWFVNWADFPSVSLIKDDFWAAHWLHKRPGGTYAYDVAIAVSSDAGQTWSEQITPHLDDTRTEHGFVSLFPWKGGVGAIWLDGRNMPVEGQPEQPDRPVSETGMTLRSAVIRADGSVTDPQVIDGLVCDCCQTDVALLPDGPVAVYRNRTEDEIRDIYVARSVDGRWQQPVAIYADDWNIAGCPVNGPAISANENQVAVAWFTAAAQQPRVRAAFSSDGGRSFAAAVTVDDTQPMGRVDIEWLSNNQAAVIWMCAPDNSSGICIRRIHSDGATGPVHLLEGSVKPGGFPQMMLAGDDLVFAWTDSDSEQALVKTASVAVSKL